MQSGFWNSFLQRSAGRETPSVTNVYKPLLWLAGVAFIATGTALKAESSQVATQTQLTANVAHGLSGTRASFVVHVAPNGGDANATGVVTLVDGTRDLGSAVLNGDGEATLSVTGLLPGDHSVHAVYQGTDTLAGSVSSDAQVTADATSTVPNFSITAANTTVTVPQGTTGTVTLTLVPQNGFSNYVTLSCSALPPDTACTFLPINVFVSGTKATTTVLSVETYGPTSSSGKLRQKSTMVYAFLFPGLLAMAGLGMRRRSDAWKNAGLMLVVFAGLGLTVGTMSGCSQRYHYLNKSPVPSPGTVLGSYTFTVEAQATSGVTVTTQLINNMVLKVTAPPS